MQGTVNQHGGEAFGEVLSLYLLSLRARNSGDNVKEREVACTCLKTWVYRYFPSQGGRFLDKQRWLQPDGITEGDVGNILFLLGEALRFQPGFDRGGQEAHVGISALSAGIEIVSPHGSLLLGALQASFGRVPTQNLLEKPRPAHVC